MLLKKRGPAAKITVPNELSFSKIDPTTLITEVQTSLWINDDE
jgi:hypothetical protein